MPPNDLLRLWTSPGLLNAADVERAVLALERPHAAHVVSIVGELVTSETVLRCVWQCDRVVGKYVEVLALPSVGTTPAREEETAVFDSSGVRACKPGIPLDVTARLRLSFATRDRLGNGGPDNLWICVLGVTILAVTTSPFVIPYACELN